MTKLAYVTDTHFRALRPKCRKDTDYLATLISDFEQVLSCASNEGCVAVLHAGDFFHNPIQSPKTIIALIELLQKWKKMPVFTTLGQHDCINRNQESYATSSALGILESCGLVTVLTNGNFAAFADCRVYGFGYDDPETALFLQNQEVVKAKTDLVKIAIIHASIASKGHNIAEHCVEDINPPSLDLMLYGDIHDFQGTYEHANGAVSYAAGALSKANSKEINREQRFAIITVDDGVFEIEEKVLTTPPIEQTFRTDMIEREKKYKAASTSAAIARMQDIKQESAPELVKRVAEEAKLSKRSVEIVLENIDENE